MRFTLIADGRTDRGGAPLVMHNERLADPLDTFTQAVAEVSKKRAKTLADHEEIAYREFLGGLYTTPPLEWPVETSEVTISWPALNVLRCLQEGAKRHKRGRDVLRGVSPLAETCELIYEGPTDPLILWKDTQYRLRKSVGVQSARTMRTRPIFADWQLSLPVEVDMTVFDTHTLQTCWEAAGRYAAFGEMRPVFGRFAGTIIQEASDE